MSVDNKRLVRIEENITDIKVSVARMEQLFISHVASHKSDHISQVELNHNIEKRLTSLEHLKAMAAGIILVVSTIGSVLVSWVMGEFKS